MRSVHRVSAICLRDRRARGAEARRAAAAAAARARRSRRGRRRALRHSGKRGGDAATCVGCSRSVDRVESRRLALRKPPPSRTNASVSGPLPARPRQLSCAAAIGVHELPRLDRPAPTTASRSTSGASARSLRDDTLPKLRGLRRRSSRCEGSGSPASCAGWHQLASRTSIHGSTRAAGQVRLPGRDLCTIVPRRDLACEPLVRRDDEGAAGQRGIDDRIGHAESKAETPDQRRAAASERILPHFSSWQAQRMSLCEMSLTRAHAASCAGARYAVSRRRFGSTCSTSATAAARAAASTP